MGTSKRYADRIDAQMNERIAQVAARPLEQYRRRAWTPPWPPIEIGAGQWIIMRDDNRIPAGIIRTLKLGREQQTYFRVVTYAPASEGRELVGYFATLDEADESILFTPKQAGPTGGPAMSHTIASSSTPKSAPPTG